MNVSLRRVALCVLLAAAWSLNAENIVVNGGFEEHETDATLGVELPTNLGGSPHQWDISNSETCEAKVVVDEAIAHTGSACLQVSVLDTAEKAQFSYVLPGTLIRPGVSFKVTVWAKDAVDGSMVTPAFFYWDSRGSKWIGIPTWAGLIPFGDWLEGTAEVVAESDWVDMPMVFKILFDVKGMGSSIYIDDLSIEVGGETSVSRPLTVRPAASVRHGAVRVFDLRGALAPSNNAPTVNITEVGGKADGVVRIAR